MHVLQVLANQKPGPLAVLIPHNSQVQLGINVETSGDEQQKRATEQESALALEARLAQQPLDRAIGHVGQILRRMAARRKMKGIAQRSADETRSEVWLGR